MTRLDDKFTVEDMKEVRKRLNKVFYNATHWETRNSSSETERELLYVVDYLTRVSGMLADMIQHDIKGHIETHDPIGYIDSKLSSAENWMKNYLNQKDLNFSKDD